MADDSIPGDVRDFIVRHVDSVAQLEALLLLRCTPDQAWDVARTASRLYAGEAQIAEALAPLHHDGLLTLEQGCYRYAPASDELRMLVDRLAETYARLLIPVTNLIHGKPRRIREFADAFKFRKDS